jgi:murein DD-endopeptidase MepM/ murein hydrolase activator NlpD
VTLSLAGRLPKPEELEAVDRGRMDAVLDGLLKEDGFYDRLKEGFNDIFLTIGYTGNADDALSYDHFEKTRHWYQKHDLSHIPEGKERTQAGYKLANDYRKALLQEPLELIAHIVRNDRPFTEIVTADYQMVSPYTARGYGIFDQVRDRFRNPEDPFEYIEARIPALKGRNGKVQETAAGIYPHAGLLTMFQYLRRYPTTVTNRNRLRARMYYQHFLGIDVMALAPRVTDAAAVAKKFANPTMEAPDCVVCHKTVDPLAGLFQDYFNEEGHYGPRKEGWFTDMFGPGREGTALPAPERWRSLQWLGQETARDPRFAVAMVEHVYYLLMGRKVPPAPQDIEDPLFTPKRRAYLEIRKEIRETAERFAKGGFNLKTVFKALVASPFYRVDGLTEAVKSPARKAELDDIGVVRLLTPEQLERKIVAVFGHRWGRLDDSDQKFAILYGGIDSKEVTQRNTEPSGAMGAIQRIMANDVACKNVARDFSRPAAERRLFPGIEIDVVPGEPEAEARIRRTIVHLHDVLLGRTHAPDHPEVDRTFRLFADIVADAKAQKGLQPQESYFCRAQENKRMDDPKYAIRAWRGVVTYLLRQDDFLYE